jgi:hypothetical protein
VAAGWQRVRWRGPGRGIAAPLLARLALAAAAALPVSAAIAADSDEDDGQTYPNVYLDLRTNYGWTPAGGLSIGFSNRTVSALARLHHLAALPSPSLPSSQSVSLDVPLTVDVNDRVSLYGGISAGTTAAGASGWSSLEIWSWNVGVQADIYQQNGGALPTLTLQSTLTRSVPDGPLATTSLNTVLEAG